jgi:hypothetical protein
MNGENVEEKKEEDFAEKLADDIGEELITDMPDPTEEAIEAEKNKQADTIAKLVDKNGEGPDPEKHVFNDDGTPKINADGTLKLKRGRKKGSTVQPKSTIGNTSNIGSSKPAVGNISARVGGVAAANLVIAIGCSIDFEEWQPQPGEKESLESAFADYFEAKGLEDIPPGWALCVALGAYALPKFTRPKTQSKLSGITRWIGEKWYKFKNRKGGNKKSEKKES